jgi:Xaa-Pro aminopeptidase
VSGPGSVQRIVIPAEEFELRARRVAELAAEQGLDAVLAWSRGGGTVDRCANALYLANYYNPWPNVTDLPPMWTGQGNAGVLITREAERVLITNVAEEEWRASDVHCDGFVDDPKIHLGAARALAERGLDRGRVGLATGDSMSAGLHQALMGATPDVQWAPADDLIMQLRRVKSAAEMDVIRAAGRAGAAMMDAMLAGVVPGNSEGDVHRAGWAAALEHGAVPYDTPGSSGPSAGLFGPSTLPSWSDRSLEDGDLWHTDMYGLWQGYLFDFSRSKVAGRASDVQLEILEASVAIVEEILDAIRPGTTFADAHGVGMEASARHAGGRPRRAARSEKHAYSHFGHTLGLGWEDLWIYEAEQTPFEPGMHVAVETSVAHPEAGFAMFEQNVLVVDGGCELTSCCESRPWRHVDLSEGT